MPRPRKARPEDQPTIWEASLRLCGSGLPRSIAELDRPQADGAAAHRRALNAVVFQRRSCQGASTYNTTEALSYGWWRVEQTVLGVHSAQSGMPRSAPR